MSKETMKATSLRTILYLSVISLIALMGSGFYFTWSYLDKMASEVSASLSSTNNNNSGQTSNQYDSYIATNKPLDDKVLSLTVAGANAESQITKDLNKYASMTNVSITAINFDAAADPTAPAINGVQTKLANTSTKEATDYNNVIKFIELIQGNNPKINITKLTIERDPVNKSKAAIKTLTIRFYVR